MKLMQEMYISFNRISKGGRFWYRFGIIGHFQYLRQRDISVEFTEKILNYYVYCYTRYITKHDENVLFENTVCIQREIGFEAISTIID